MKRLASIMIIMLFVMACDGGGSQPISSSGVQKVTVEVATNIRGRTVEQENIASRLEEDNKVGSIKHLYVISAFSGDVIIYSTVRGKVTSGGKRLTPLTLMGDTEGVRANRAAVRVDIGGKNLYTTEVIQDDGTYGHSAQYLYWWDTKGIYHQHYVSGGQIVHISSQPLVVDKVIINMELSSVE